MRGLLQLSAAAHCYLNCNLHGALTTFLKMSVSIPNVTLSGIFKLATSNLSRVCVLGTRRSQWPDPSRCHRREGL